MNSGFCWTASRLLMTQRRPATPRNPERGPVEFSKWISSNLRASGHVIPCSQQKKNNQIRWHNLNQRPVSLGMVHGTLLYFQPSPMLMWKKTPERYLPSISTKTRPFCRLMIGARYEKTGEIFFQTPGVPRFPSELDSKRVNSAGSVSQKTHGETICFPVKLWSFFCSCPQTVAALRMFDYHHLKILLELWGNV